MRNDQIFDSLLDKIKQFIDEIGLVEYKLLETRTRRRKPMPGKIAPDEIIPYPNKPFKVN